MLKILNEMLIQIQTDSKQSNKKGKYECNDISKLPGFFARSR